jgi:hypothetical protein
MRAALLALVCACSTPMPDMPDAGDAAPPIPILADSVSFGDVSVSQGTKSLIVSAGMRVDPPDVPIIAARPALVRVFLNLAPTFGKVLEGELHLFDVDGTPGKVLTDKKKLAKVADDGQLASSLNFEIPPDLLTADTQFAIVVRDPAFGTRPEASIRWPADGTNAPFGAKTDSAELKVKIVPIQYDFDGSHRIPPTDAGSIQSFHDFLYRMYPVSTVTLTVHDPVPWDGMLGPDGTGWDNLLLTLYAIRSQEKTAKDVYFVALFNPAPTFAQFCMTGCQGGVGFLDAATDPSMRIVEMVGYQDDFVYGTLNQELAHDMGRLHAPCGSPQMVDPKFPYPDGSIGKWGWDILSKQLVDPSTNDFLSYCQPVYVSDYTFAGLYDQMSRVTLSTKSIVPPSKWRVAHVDPKGHLRLGSTITWGGPIQRTRPVRANGQVQNAPYWDLSEIHRGILLLPENTSRVSWL